MCVTRVENHVLIVVLDTVEFPNHLVMAVVKGDERDNVPSLRPFRVGKG